MTMLNERVPAKPPFPDKGDVVLRRRKTPDGAAFYGRCLRLIADMDETENLFRQSTMAPAGTLRVDVPARIGRLIVAPALPEFLERYPQINIELGITDRIVNLVEDRVDCALRVGLLPDSDLVARPMFELPLINVASPAYACCLQASA